MQNHLRELIDTNVGLTTEDLRGLPEPEHFVKSLGRLYEDVPVLLEKLLVKKTAPANPVATDSQRFHLRQEA